MKAWWAEYSQRIDKLSQRERAFLFLSILVLCLALADTLWLSPALKAQKQLSQTFTAQAAEVNRLRAELQLSGHPTDVNAAVRDEVAHVDEKLDVLSHAIGQMASAAHGGLDLEKVLLQFLRRQEGLTLVSTGTLSQETERTKLPGLSRRGMELRVSGSYANLARYVKELETAMPELRWGPMALKTDTLGTELRMQVYVVEVQLP